MGPVHRLTSFQAAPSRGDEEGPRVHKSSNIDPRGSNVAQSPPPRPPTPPPPTYLAIVPSPYLYFPSVRHLPTPAPSIRCVPPSMHMVMLRGKQTRSPEVVHVLLRRVAEWATMLIGIPLRHCKVRADPLPVGHHITDRTPEAKWRTCQVSPVRIGMHPHVPIEPGIFTSCQGVDRPPQER